MTYRGANIPYGLMVLGRVWKHGAKVGYDAARKVAYIRFVMYLPMVGGVYSKQSVFVHIGHPVRGQEFPEDKIPYPMDEVLVKGKLSSAPLQASGMDGLPFDTAPKSSLFSMSKLIVVGPENVRLYLETLWENYLRDRDATRAVFLRHKEAKRELERAKRAGDGSTGILRIDPCLGPVTHSDDLQSRTASLRLQELHCAQREAGTDAPTAELGQDGQGEA